MLKNNADNRTKTASRLFIAFIRFLPPNLPPTRKNKNNIICTAAISRPCLYQFLIQVLLYNLVSNSNTSLNKKGQQFFCSAAALNLFCYDVLICIAFKLFSFCSLITCVYNSKVMFMLLCPNISLNILKSCGRCSIKRVANVFLKAWQVK